MKTDAKYYEKIQNKIHCYLCPHHCVIEEGHHGKCNVRFHQNGKLYTLNYGEITASSLDPIEKKPLHYYKPDSQIFSVGSFGCNMTCTFCQNHEISQRQAESNYIAPEKLIEITLTLENNIGIAFTYNEPTIWYEYVYDCAKKLKETSPDISVVLVTNGFINERPLTDLLPYIDAMNIDLKSFSNAYYKNICGARLDPVLKTIELASKSSHVEVTTLLVRGENDTLEEVESIGKFLHSIDANIPLHLSRYFPRYQMESPATDITFMMKAQELAHQYVNKVILGNVSY
jgi:pyruvate formate lyase activating enzyme